MKHKAVFLDRDGIINRAIIKNNIPYSPRKLSEFTLNTDIKPVIEVVKKHGYIVIVVTNQPDVARGLLKESTLQRMHTIIRKNLPIDDIYYCPHDDLDKCPCRKPKPGMLFEAAKKWNITLAESYFLGDQERDVHTAINAGCCPIILDYPYNRDENEAIRIYNFSELLDYIKE
jgi:D-glycero-D-manno-heptose 1,7-bisphosphate phosphatase